MNKTFLICLIFLILSSCSYKPILSKKNYDFQFVNINSNGERNINQIIIKNLSKNSKWTKKYDINFTTEKSKEIVSTNEEGDPRIYKLNIFTKYIIIKNGGNILEKSISKQSTYSNIEDKYELNKYEENILKILSENISVEILNSIKKLK